MNEPVSVIRNLGPASVEFYARAGITSAKELRTLGADEAYLRALQAGGRPHFIGYYVLVMGLQGRPWNDCHGTEKDDLKQRFGQIKANVAGITNPADQIDQDLAAIGVIK